MTIIKAMVGGSDGIMAVSNGDSEWSMVGSYGNSGGKSRNGQMNMAMVVVVAIVAVRCWSWHQECCFFWCIFSF